MEKDSQFIPVDPDEPIPTAAAGSGATDAGLGGTDVTDEYFDEEGHLLGVLATGALGTWTAVYAKLLSYLGSKPPGWERENVNAFTRRFYGNGTKAAWCLIIIWCVLNDFFTTAWKLAYVPWLYKIAGEKNGHSGIRVGAICAISKYSHVGIFVADHPSTDEFDLWSGNSFISASKQDGITIKRYKKSIISGYVNVDYATAPAKSTDDAWFAGSR